MSGQNQRLGSPSTDEAQRQRLEKAKKFRKPLITILDEIFRIKGKLNPDLVKENNLILQEFLETFITEMKLSDPLFVVLFNRIYFTGSYYSHLRVSAPDEYDLNLVLKFPFKQRNVSVQYEQQVPSYAKYSTTNIDRISEKGLKKLFKDGYLIPHEVRAWFESVVAKALRTYTKYPQKVNNIKTSGSGPARTIILVKENGVIDIDLVPAVECSMDLKPPGINDKVYKKVKDNLKCFLVPKPYQPSKQAPVNEAVRARLWRAHYPEAEHIILHNLGCAKPVIKLLKLLRDKENWKILASYYLKTIVMWMVLENSTSNYWNNGLLGERFMDALNILAKNVEGRKIPYFFSSRYNLLEKLTAAEAENIHNRLRNIITDIEKDPENLWDIFGCDKAFSLPVKL